MSEAVVWFRRDLRLGDNPAWASAARTGRTVRAVFVWDPPLIDAGSRRIHHLTAELDRLDHQLQELGGRLHVLRGSPSAALAELIAGHDVRSVHLNRDVSPYAKRRDRAVADMLDEAGVERDGHWGTLVQPPGAVLTQKGALSKVFSPFHRRWRALAAPVVKTVVPRALATESGEGVASSTTQPIDTEAKLAAFRERLSRYPADRDLPATEGTSDLSAALKWGALGPREVAAHLDDGSDEAAAFTRQLAWRDWWAHTLYANPALIDRAARAEFDHIEWENDPNDLAAWKQGMTGYPLVDAGMRELLSSGRLHNRVRMVAASFLVKHLLVDWRIGERFFRQHLLDADVAQNVGNWQWVAGLGPDAAPYFRVFNPTTQSVKFDKGGSYLRRWLPELRNLSAGDIHRPWQVPRSNRAGYPDPIIDHHFARDRALERYRAARSGPWAHR